MADDDEKLYAGRDQNDNAADDSQDEVGFSIVGLHSRAIVEARINEQALVHFLGAVVRTLVSFPLGQREMKNTRIALAILPTGGLLIEIIGPRRASSVQRLTELHAELSKLRCPPVRGGPLAFTIFAGEPWDESDYRHRPFVSLVRKFHGRTIDELICQAAGIVPETALNAGTPWWKRAAAWMAARVQFRSATVDAATGTDTQSHEPPTVESLSAAIQCDPDSAVNYFRRAEFYRRDEEYRLAMDDYNAAIARYGEPSESLAAAWLGRGACYLYLSEYQPALIDLTEALRHDPELTPALVLRAQVYQSLEAWSAAEIDLTTALTLDPHEPRWYRLRAQVRACQQCFREALEDAESALDADPHDDMSYALRGVLRKELAENVEQLETALEDFTVAAVIGRTANHHLACGDLALRLGRAQQALEAAEHALRCEPGNASALGLRGIATHMSDGLTADVIRDCTAAIEGNCQTAMIFVSRGEAHLREHSLHAALEDFDKAIQLDPEMPTAYNCRGVIRANLEMDELARDDFERAIERAPSWAPPLLNRAEWHRQHDDLDSALDDVDQVLATDATDAKARLLRGICRLAKEQFDAAREDFDDAVVHAADWPQTWCERGKYWLSQGELESARSDFDHALSLDPNHLEALMLRSTALVNLNLLQAALADANHLIELSPDLLQAYAGRASIWLMLGRPDKAREDTDKVLEEHPEASEELRVHHLLLQASVHLRNEKYEQTIERAEDVLKEYSDCLPARRLRAVALWHCEHFVEAIDEYDWLLENDEESAGYLNSRGQLWAELGEFDRAIADLDRATELVAGVAGSETLAAYIHNGRGVALAGLNRTAEGIAELGRSIQERPQNAWAQFNLGLVYFRSSEPAKAATCFRMALELNGPRLTPRKRARAQAFLAKMASQGSVPATS